MKIGKNDMCPCVVVKSIKKLNVKVVGKSMKFML